MDFLVFEVIGIRPLAPVHNSVSLRLMERKALNFAIKGTSGVPPYSALSL